VFGWVCGGIWQRKFSFFLKKTQLLPNTSEDVIFPRALNSMILRIGNSDLKGCFSYLIFSTKIHTINLQIKYELHFDVPISSSVYIKKKMWTS